MAVNKAVPDSPLQLGSELVDKKVRRDDNYPAIHEVVSAQGYSNSYSDKEWHALERLKLKDDRVIELPDFILQQLGDAKVVSMRGLFPDISCVWITVDRRLFLWNYETRGDPIVYEGLDQIIVCAAVVPPKKDMFVDEVKHMLVLATPVEIVLLAVHVDSATQFMQLIDTKYSLPSDEVNMASVVGTKTGRIFLAGRDGCLYELDYQSSSSWWNALTSRKVRKLNHSASPLASFVPKWSLWGFGGDQDKLSSVVYDDSRNILYTLSDNNVIRVYDLGERGYDMTEVKTYDKLALDAESKCSLLNKFTQSKHVLDLVQIHPVVKSESTHVHLIAVSKAGIRFYFSTFPSIDTFEASRPRLLRLVHVRLPPERYARVDPPGVRLSTPNDDQGLVNYSIHSSFYGNGVFLYADEVNAQNDVLNGAVTNTAWDVHAIGATAAHLSSHVRFRELAETLKGEGKKIWHLSEVPLSSIVDTTYLGEAPVLRNDLAYQHLNFKRRFLCLTNTDVRVFEKVPPLDDLRHLLRREGIDSKSLETFRNQFTIDEYCAMLITIAVGDYRPPDRSRSPGINLVAEDSIAALARQALLKYCGQPTYDLEILKEADVNIALNLVKTSLKYSGLHEGLAIYLSRLLRPLWRKKLFSVREVPQLSADGRQGTTKQFRSSFSKAHFAKVEADLARLRDWLKQYGIAQGEAAPVQSSRDSGRGGAAFKQRRYDEEAYKLESNSMSNLSLVLTKAIECIAFLALIQDFDLASVISRVDIAVQNRLSTITISSFLASDGQDMAKELVQAIVLFQSNTGNLGVVDSINELLVKRCPTLFTAEDDHRYRGDEMVERAKVAKTVEERFNLLQLALREYLQIPLALFQSNALPRIVEVFRFLRFYRGVLELCLACANSVDPAHLALKFAKEGFKESNEEGKAKYDMVASCYGLFFGLVLPELHDDPVTVPPLFDPKTNKKVDRPELSPEELTAVAAETMSFAIRSNDELFHFILYQWYLDHKLEQGLLNFNSPYIEGFLLQYATPRETGRELLWKFYAKHERFSSAADILLELAHGSTTQTLEQRVELLARAGANARSALSQAQARSQPLAIRRPDSAGVKKLSSTVQELDESLEIAKIQMKVYEEVNRITDQEVRNDLHRRLNERLYTVSELFNEYASRFALAESALALVKASGHNDTALIRSLWKTLLDDAVEGAAAPNGEQSMASLIIRLGRDYYPNNTVFPVDHLVAVLERYSVEVRQAHSITWSPFWVVDAFINIGVPFYELFEIYKSLIESPDAFFKMHLSRIYRGFFRVVAQWLTALNSRDVSDSERRAFREAQVDKVIEGILTQIQTLPASEAENLRHQFKDLQRQVTQRTH